MKTLFRIFIAGIVTAVSFAGDAGAQTIVTGTGNPDVDVAAVQAAVDRGGEVVLRGRFSFDNPPAMRGTLPELMAMVLVSREVAITGTWDERGQMTTIEGGEIPFAVEAPGARVRIERLRFVRSKLFAIFVDEADGLEIESCTMETVQPMPLPGVPSGLTSALGIYVSTVLGLPNSEQRGIPGNVSGKLSFLNNQISVNPAASHAIGIMVVNVGTLEKPVDVEISGNTIRDSTLKGINVTQIDGQARVERNTIVTGVYTGRPRGLSSGIHCGGSGRFLIAHNRIDVADPNSAGIRIRGYPALGAAIEHASITDNEVTMSAPDGTVFSERSAGIEIMGLARGSIVQRNTIRGRARAGLTVTPDKAGSPAGSTLDQNDQQGLRK